MNEQNLYSITKQLVASDKGILAADESVLSVGRRFLAIGLENSVENRRAYRELLFTTPNIEKNLSGVILFDETIRQSASNGIPFVELLLKKGIIPGIKVDQGTEDFPGFPGELITKGLSGLPERLKEYHGLGARFAKWRAVIKIGEGIPTDKCIENNAESLAKYAKICQEHWLVPIVEPEVLMDGAHNIEKCLEITKKTLSIVFEKLKKENVDNRALLLKPNMVINGLGGQKVSSKIIAEMTVGCFRQVVPSDVGGIVFLSGGQSEEEACQNLNAINLLAKDDPWELSFSFGRALQTSALLKWGGKAENFQEAQCIFFQRANLVGMAREGKIKMKSHF